jgi:hypothetical protein
MDGLAFRFFPRFVYVVVLGAGRRRLIDDVGRYEHARAWSEARRQAD